MERDPASRRIEDIWRPSDLPAYVTSRTGHWCPVVTRFAASLVTRAGGFRLPTLSNRFSRGMIGSVTVLWYDPCKREHTRPVSEPASDHKRQVPVHDDVRLVGGRQSGRSGSATGLTTSEPQSLLIRHIP